MKIGFVASNEFLANVDESAFRVYIEQKAKRHGWTTGELTVQVEPMTSRLEYGDLPCSTVTVRWPDDLTAQRRDTA